MGSPSHKQSNYSEEQAKNSGCETVDLRSVFTDPVSDPAERRDSDGLHFSDAGNRVAADKIFQKIQEKIGVCHK